MTEVKRGGRRMGVRGGVRGGECVRGGGVGIYECELY